MMTVDSVIDVLMLLTAIIGMLGSLYSYIEKPGKGWLFLTGYYFASFLSGYYWITSTLVTHVEPNVSEFTAYFGWNVAYVVLLVAVYEMKHPDTKGFRPLISFIPIPINLIQFFIYIQFGGWFNNVWQVSFTTVIMIFCLQSILFQNNNKKDGRAFPYFNGLVLTFCFAEYVTWTASCFDWPSNAQNPYYYFSVISYAAQIFMPWAMKKEYEARGVRKNDSSSSEIKFQALLQVIVSFIVFGGCIGGYYLALRMKDALPSGVDNSDAYTLITTMLFLVSVFLGVLILIVIFFITIRYKAETRGKADTPEVKETVRLKRSKANLFLTLLVTFSLMTFAVIYNSKLFFSTYASGVYSSGEDKTTNISTELDNYLTLAMSTLNVAAETVDYMLARGDSSQEISDYIYDQTQRQFENFDENFTGLYAVVDSEYIDGDGWVPPSDYKAMTRDWYKTAVAAGGKIVIVSPYVDAQTGSVVITICKMLKEKYYDGNGRVYYNVVALDVKANHIQEITESADISGSGYAMIVNSDGFIISHRDSMMRGMMAEDVYGEGFMERVIDNTNPSVGIRVNDEEYTFFTSQVMDQWYVVMAVKNSDLLDEAYSQVTVNVMVSLTIFVLISIFYYLGYRNEQAYGKKVEEMSFNRQKQEYEAQVLRLEKRSADAANKAKSSFLADMSHEIRTPINAILGMNEMIMREADSPNIREYAGNIKNSGRNLLQLINSILDFSKIEDGKMEIVPVRYSLRSLITYLVNSIQDRADAKNLNFIVNVDPNLPCELNGDDARINQVILNLLTNAVKYTPAGSVTLNIGEKDRTENMVLLHVSVADTGIGIKESDMGKLFESFERLDVVRNRTIEGTGLGMSITTRLLDLMESGLNVQSKYGEGSVFSFDLWQKIENPQPMGEYRMGRVDDNSHVYTESFHAPDAHILLVDDTHMNILVVVNLLKKTGVQIDTAESGEAAVELAARNVYDVILLDQRMPGMDGTETLKCIRELENKLNEKTPVICLTADAIRGAKERYLAQGFTDYLTKPVEGRTLEQMLMTYLPDEKVSKGAGRPREPEPDIFKAMPEPEGISEEGAPEADSDIVGALSNAGFDTQKAMVFTHNDVDFYRTILTVFASEYDERYAKLNEFYSGKKWKDYSILIHAIKSNATTIGALKLAEVAATMEQATKNEEEDIIHKEHENALAQYSDAALIVKKTLGLKGGMISSDSDIMEFAPNMEPEIFEFKPEGK